MQSRELRYLASMYKQRLLNECGYLKSCNKQNDLKHDTKHVSDCNRHVQGSIAAAPLRHTRIENPYGAHKNVVCAACGAYLFRVETSRYFCTCF